MILLWFFFFFFEEGEGFGESFQLNLEGIQRYLRRLSRCSLCPRIFTFGR